MKEAKRKKISVKILVIIYIITSIFVIDFTFSKYTSSVTMSSNSATVAVMASNTEVNINQTISGYPGFESEAYPIKLTNKKGSKICEVSQEFEIFVDKDNFKNIPIEFEMYKDPTCTEIIEKNEKGIFTCDEFKFKPGVEESKTFYLKIFWPEDKNESSLAFEVDYFKLHIITTQID